MNRLNLAFSCEVRLAMDERKELPVVKIALRQRHIHVKELRGSVNRDFQYQDRTKRAKLISFYLSGADTTGSAAK
jgi:hypothetical protein